MFTLKRVRDMIRTYSQIHRTYTYSQHSSIIKELWPSSWVVRLSTNWLWVWVLLQSLLNFRYHACFEKGVPQATIECRFTLKRVGDMTISYTEMNRPDKYSKHNSIIRSFWLGGCVFVYELVRWGFESRFSHLNFRCHACFEQGVPWY